jgi:hypothetical protein
VREVHPVSVAAAAQLAGMFVFGLGYLVFATADLPRVDAAGAAWAAAGGLFGAVGLAAAFARLETGAIVTRRSVAHDLLAIVMAGAAALVLDQTLTRLDWGTATLIEVTVAAGVLCPGMHHRTRDRAILGRLLMRARVLGAGVLAAAGIVAVNVGLAGTSDLVSLSGLVFAVVAILAIANW